MHHSASVPVRESVHRSLLICVGFPSTMGAEEQGFGVAMYLNKHCAVRLLDSGAVYFQTVYCKMEKQDNLVN